MAHEAAVTIALDQDTEQTQSLPQESLSFELESVSPEFGYIHITIPSRIIDVVYDQAAQSQQNATLTHGFNRGKVPLEYIKENFRSNLVEHLKEFLLRYCVTNFLYEQIRLNKLMVCGEPRLYAMQVEPKKDAVFSFEVSLFSDLTIYEWKYFPFKAPKRKNYKDIDRQVESFIEEEKKHLQDNIDEALQLGDWVNFELSLLDQNNKPLFGNFSQKFWFKLGNDDTENPLRHLFIGKKVGDEFSSTHPSLQRFLSDQIDTAYNFAIKIAHRIAYSFFDLDLFKHIFRVKTNKDMNRKLIEVFSYRNDMSQRHTMVEEAFRVLLSKHKFSIPNHIILRKEKILLESVRHNPDYNVYRAQKNFQDYIRNLAKKQSIEKIFIDKLAYTENINISDEDIKGYLNLTNRQRMKEFIYFHFPSSKRQGQEAPIPAEKLKRTCLREKAINYVIYHLTKK